MVKILLCSPYKGSVGGISIWTKNILKYYHSSNSEINLNHYYVRSRGVQQNTSNLNRLKVGIRSYIPFLIGLRNKIDEQNYDVVHFVSSASISMIRDILSLKIVKHKQIKCVIHFHFGRIPDLFKNNTWERKLMHSVINLADKVIVIDKKSFDTLIENGYSNVELLPNPLSQKVKDIIEINKNIVRNERKLVFAGHVVETKGIYELIEVCKNITKIKLKIVGKITDEMQTEIFHRAGRNYSNWLEIAGEQSIETTIKEMLSAGIFVLPTYTEGFPNVIIESMACACPIITTNVGAIPQMLDIKNGDNYGICIDAKNVDQLNSAIQRMLNDREYATNCGLNAQKRVHEKYSMESVTDEMEKIWESVL